VGKLKNSLAYLKYLLKHKWFVFLACWRLGVPLRRALVHDWSKLTPAEFGGYKRYFFDRKDEFRKGPLDPKKVDTEFDLAWNHHQKANKHHWDYWCLVGDKIAPPRPLPMPETYVREMLADWMGAGRAKTGSWDMESWVMLNCPRMLLHPDTAMAAWDILRHELLMEKASEVMWDAHCGEPRYQEAV
jgi:hypothetical protein